MSEGERREDKPNRLIVGRDRERKEWIIYHVYLMLVLGALMSIARKTPDLLDGAPFVAGCVTVLRQFHSDNTEHTLIRIGQFVRSLIEAQVATR